MGESWQIDDRNIYIYINLTYLDSLHIPPVQCVSQEEISRYPALQPIRNATYSTLIQDTLGVEGKKMLAPNIRHAYLGAWCAVHCIIALSVGVVVLISTRARKNSLQRTCLSANEIIADCTLLLCLDLTCAGWSFLSPRKPLVDKIRTADMNCRLLYSDLVGRKSRQRAALCHVKTEVRIFHAKQPGRYLGRRRRWLMEVINAWIGKVDCWS